MKIVVAIDSFKGSASSREVNDSVARAAKMVLPDADVQAFSIADGGEGTLDALRDAFDGETITVRTLDLMERPIDASYLRVGQQAFIESASVVGIDKVSPSPESFERATSFGLGLLIKDAVERGCREVYLTLGGTGTSDGGFGLLKNFGFDGKNLDFSFPDDWEDVKLVGLTDVQNIYAGPSGFAKVFGRQKGGSDAQLLARDSEAMEFASWVKAENGIDLQVISGAGAAGGLGAAIVLLGGQLEPGFQRIASILGLEEQIRNADLVVTGEGRLDGQSKEGKVPYGIANLAKKYSVPAIALCGTIADHADWVWDEFLAVFSIQTQVVALDEAMDKERTLTNLEFVTKNVLRTVNYK